MSVPRTFLGKSFPLRPAPGIRASACAHDFFIFSIGKAASLGLPALRLCFLRGFGRMCRDVTSEERFMISGLCEVNGNVAAASPNRGKCVTFKNMKVSADAPSGGRPHVSRSTLPRVLNILLWLVFCGMSGTGLLLAFRLPPGSRGGAGLAAMGWGRHDWGWLHTWLSYVFLVLIVSHLALHWRWLWQVAARRHSWPLVAGFGTGLAIILFLALQPVAKRGPHHGGPKHEDAAQVR
ncbi:MAG: DUF4405 domain-containing protein [Chthoniobacterales bacterium]|nr:DUF4405 domain-containing protein [Chthoniobacterales bacterium]